MMAEKLELWNCSIIAKAIDVDHMSISPVILVVKDYNFSIYLQ
jgi:hypothetical protein